MKFCTRAILFLSLSLSLVTFGCDKKEAEEPATTEAAVENVDEAKPEAQGAEKAEAPAEKAPEKLAKVELTATGTKFDPPIKVEQLPAGAWYCDMGTVHWASLENPKDGRCPECNMKLKQYDPDALAAQKKQAVEPHGHAHDDEHGHAHDDEHGHAH
ncbi:hypothetical protein [Bradymonas sediminis]|nr:hypothetical protein [Bradymonas sediminis]TDP63646.1 hypothetical protein DFR33_110104 [Bradymonas sediminis]